MHMTRCVRGRASLDNPFASTETMLLSELHTLDIFYTPLEARFERITRLAQRALRVPVAAIALVDKERLWFKAVAGWNIVELPTKQSLCMYTLRGRELIIVEDAQLDPRFTQHPLVVNSPGFRFYAGIPLFSKGDFAIGTLSVYDTAPRKMTMGQCQALYDLAAIVQKELVTTELCEAQAKFIQKLDVARRQASIDELTRVWTRRAGLQILRECLERNTAEKRLMAVCMIDIDDFKSMNDTLGHQQGDQILRKVATGIVNCLRDQDIVCRYGGDEFLLILEDNSEQKLVEICERLRRSFSSAPIKIRSSVVNLTLSIGIAVVAQNTNESLESTIERADLALFRAKDRGKNLVERSTWRDTVGQDTAPDLQADAQQQKV